MGELIDLARWRDRRIGASAGRAATPGDCDRTDAPRVTVRPVARHRGRPEPQADGLQEQIDRLDLAVARIDRMTGRIAAHGDRLSPEIETELLALVGEIGLGLVDDAANRAERVARFLGGSAASST